MPPELQFNESSPLSHHFEPWFDASLPRLEHLSGEREGRLEKTKKKTKKKKRKKKGGNEKKKERMKKEKGQKGRGHKTGQTRGQTDVNQARSPGSPGETCVMGEYGSRDARGRDEAGIEGEKGPKSVQGDEERCFAGVESEFRGQNEPRTAVAIDREALGAGGHSIQKGEEKSERRRKKERETERRRSEGDRGGGMSYLLYNPFAQGCFVPGQQFKSCGQFSNLIMDLLHALAVSKILGRTLVLPGFYWRKGRRLSRVSRIQEVWTPTSQFINISVLQQAFDVIPAQKFKELLVQETRRERGRVDVSSGKKEINAGILVSAGQGIKPRVRWYSEFGIRFDAVHVVSYPIHLVQAREPRWGYVPHNVNHIYKPNEDIEGVKSFQMEVNPRSIEYWWRAFRLRNPGDGLLSLDWTPSFGFEINGLVFDAPLHYIKKHVVYNDVISEVAHNFVEERFNGRSFLAVHLRRGVDRLFEFCNTNDALKTYGWRVSRNMCWPRLSYVARKIKQMRDKLGLSGVFLASDILNMQPLERQLTQYGVSFHRYASDANRFDNPYSLQVDQTICSLADGFLGNFPSTVTVYILMERDRIGKSRDTFDFFGSKQAHRKVFRYKIPYDKFHEPPSMAMDLAGPGLGLRVDYDIPTLGIKNGKVASDTASVDREEVHKP